MAMSEQFSLRWNDFHSNLSSSFHALLEGKDLVDVTLAAGGHYLYAHKLILSVCSPYFKELFKTNPCEHPIVILKDVAHQQLNQLLQFMYRGEVHVRQQELQGFLHAAELLQVKGLTSPGREKSESPPPPAIEEPKHKQTPSESDSQPEWVPEDLTIADGTNDAAPAPFVASTPTVKEEPGRSPLKRLLKTSQKNSGNVNKKMNLSNESQNYTENSEYNLDNEPLIEFDNDLFHSVMSLPETTKDSRWLSKSVPVIKCPSCHRFFKNRYNLKVHIRDKHDTREGTLQCDICHKHMRNPSCLRVHMYHHRKQAAYLAQIGSQSEGVSTRDVQNIMGKWRNSNLLAGGDFKDNESLSSSAQATDSMKLEVDPGATDCKPEPETEQDQENV